MFLEFVFEESLERQLLYCILDNGESGIGDNSGEIKRKVTGSRILYLGQ